MHHPDRVTNLPAQSLSAVFVASQNEIGRRAISHRAFQELFKAFFQDTAACPCKKDYCAECGKLKKMLSTLDAEILGLLKAGTATEALIQRLRKNKQLIQKQLDVHRKQVTHCFTAVSCTALWHHHTNIDTCLVMLQASQERKAYNRAVEACKQQYQDLRELQQVWEDENKTEDIKRAARKRWEENVKDFELVVSVDYQMVCQTCKSLFHTETL